MITAIIDQKKRTNDGEFVTEYDGLSTDTKPLKAAGAKNADVFFEMDTGKAYKFDETGNRWLEV